LATEHESKPSLTGEIEMDITIGCDPEVFLRNKTTGKIVSAHGLFPGTKSKPHKVDKGAIQVDGTALEFNIDPASTEDEFVGNINTVMTQMYNMVQEVDPDLEILLTPVATFDNEDWNKIPEEAKVLGCDPDFDSYGSVNPSPAELIEFIPVRTAAGHIHIGWNEKKVTREDQLAIVNTAERNLICEAVAWENDLSSERRKYYGAAGAHRPKPYGVEVRSTDNLWLTDECHMRTLYQSAYKAAKEVLNA
jgi:hypothetical protein